MDSLRAKRLPPVHRTTEARRRRRRRRSAVRVDLHRNAPPPCSEGILHPHLHHHALVLSHFRYAPWPELKPP